METLSLGSSVLAGSRMAYGCWRVVGTADGLELTPERQANARRAITTAYETGFTLFDNADVYASGEAERGLGQTLQEVSGMRQRVVIATKCGIRRQGEPQPESPYRYDFSAG